MSKGRCPQFNAQNRPGDAWDGERAIGQGVADGRAPGRSVQGSAQPEQRRDLAQSALRLEVAVFVEQCFLGVIEFP
jgi:hypothetical protein